MKKYVKPDLYYENFELSHNVAACSAEYKYDANQSDGYSCTMDLDGDLFFYGDVCSQKGVDIQGKLEQFCYQTGSDGVSLFSS